MDQIGAARTLDMVHQIMIIQILMKSSHQRKQPRVSEKEGSDDPLLVIYCTLLKGKGRS